MNSSMLLSFLISILLINEYSCTPITMPTGAGLGNGMLLPDFHVNAGPRRGGGGGGGYGYGGYGYGGGLGMGLLGLEAASLRGLGGVAPLRAPIGGVAPIGVGMPVGMGMGMPIGMGMGMGMGLGMGYGGFGLPPTALPPSFGRPSPSGLHAGRFGALTGSPAFGPALIGPFNNPIAREERIDELINHNRRISGQKPLTEPARLYQYGYDYY